MRTFVTGRNISLTRFHFHCHFIKFQWEIPHFVKNQYYIILQIRNYSL